MWCSDWIDLSVEYARRFGETIDPDERAEIEADYEKALAALNEQYEKYMGQYDVHSEDDCHLLYSAADAARNKDYESEDYRKGAERWDAENLEKLAETCDQIFWDKITKSSGTKFLMKSLTGNKCWKAF